MRWIKLFVLLPVFLYSTGLFSQAEKLQTVFIYNFTKHIEWPESYRQGDFVIGVLGNAAIVEELEELAKNRRVGGQPIVVKKYRDVSEIGKCHILFIPENRSADIGSVLSALKNGSTLIITDKKGLATAGAAINFVVEGNKQKFELNKKNATKYGLKVSSDLERLAIIIN